MDIQEELRILKAYAVISTLLFAVLITMAVADHGSKQKLHQIDVQRINFVEPDGTLGMVLSDKADFLRIIYKEKKYPHPNCQTASMLFFNNECSENGGLIFVGKKDANGSVENYGHLSFDAYDQDQVSTVDSDEDGTRKQSGLEIVDRPDWPISGLFTIPQNQWKQFLNGKPMPHPRIYLGRSDDRSAALKIKDADGHDRLAIRVAADGSPAIQFLDATGKVISQLPAPVSH